MYHFTSSSGTVETICYSDYIAVLSSCIRIYRSHLRVHRVYIYPTPAIGYRVSASCGISGQVYTAIATSTPSHTATSGNIYRWRIISNVHHHLVASGTAIHIAHCYSISSICVEPYHTRVSYRSR